ncbi:MAG: flagellar assembly peptidoglycan hydrolase FlgJ [Gallionella sp.]|nr:flagellar assembly peptidoglycan hydrolase FlgJ [Gallionella sp.]
MVMPLNDPSMLRSLAADSQSLDSLRAQAKQSPDKALKAAAQQFESVFLNMMLKSMREATPQDGMFDNEQTKMFTGMLDQQFAQNMATRGVGLADMMVKQLSRNSGALDMKGAAASERGSVITPASLATSSAAAIPSAYNADFQQAFMNRMLPHAQQASQPGGVPVHMMLGQAALESGWGKHEIRNADGTNSHNLFGIKAGSNWNGKVAAVTTTEYENGVARKQVQNFRAYPSYAAAFQDYAQLINNNPRYAEVLQQGGDHAGMAQAMQRAGYATDPNYANKLVQVMSKLDVKS